MKAGWEVKPLGEICDIAPKKVQVKQAVSDGDSVSFVPMDHLGELKSDFSPKEDRKLSSVYTGYTYFADDDVIIAKITPCFENGKMGIAKGMTNGVGFGSSEFVPIRGRGETVPEYLFYYLLRDEFREAGRRVMSGAVGHKRVPKDYLECLPIPLPPLDEQKLIVAVLDAAFEDLTRARKHVETNLQNARELFAALLLGFQNQGDDVWLESSLEELVTKDCTLSYGIVQPGDEVSDGLPIVRPTDLGKREIYLDGLKRIDPERSSGYTRTVLQGGELLLCVRGTTGTIGIAATELNGANVTRGIVPIRFDPSQLLQRFGYYAFVSSPVQKQIAAATYGAALQQINIRDVRKLMFAYPSIEVQKKILDALDEAYDRAETLQTHYRAKLQDLDDLRQSLLKKAFAGELT